MFDGALPDVDILFSNSFTTVLANWNGFRDYESGIDHFTLHIFQQDREIYSETIDGMEYSLEINRFQFEDGDEIVVGVVAFNGAGDSVGVNSTGVTIDLSPPEVTALVDGSDVARDWQYQVSNDTLIASWSVMDEESGVDRISGRIYEIREGRRTRIYPLRNDYERIPSNQSTWRVEGLELVTGSRYIVSLSFANGADLEVMHESNGVIVDTTPPSVVSVRVLSDSYTDTTDTTDTTVIVANPNQTELRWSAMDPESGISHYLVGVVAGNGTLTDAYEEFDGSTLGGILQILPLTPGVTFRAAVVAVNQAGEESERVYSDPFR